MIIAIIQARMGSTRLPKKVLKKLEDKTVLEHVYYRTILSNLIDKVVVATSVESNNFPLIELCGNRNIPLYIGSENDVLDRYYQAARLFGATHIVRITADCPLIDSKLIDEIIQIHIEGRFDYTSNTLTPTYPDGLDTEVVTIDALQKAWQFAKKKYQREHVTPYIKESDLFVKYNVCNKIDLSAKRWTIDEEADYEFLKLVFKDIYTRKKNFDMQDVLAVLKNNSNLEQINSHINRNEGFKKEE